MGLEVRTGRGGELRKHWYGSYIESTGKRRVVALKEPPGTPFLRLHGRGRKRNSKPSRLKRGNKAGLTI